ncbi:unnamed protein product, partial [Tetraodon nigroviridis]
NGFPHVRVQGQEGDEARGREQGKRKRASALRHESPASGLSGIIFVSRRPTSYPTA